MRRYIPSFDTVVLFIAAALTAGCGGAGNNTQTANAVPTSTPSMTPTATATPASVVEARVPDQYQANVTLKVESTGGSQTVALPTLTAKVAKSGDNRRMEFTMPAGGHVVYLDTAASNYLVLPDRKEYAEVDRESTGFDVRRMMMPEQIVDRVKAIPGVTRVGDDTMNGRAVTKYRYDATSATGTPAGDVKTEAFIYVDKETGLPLRSELVSTASGNVKGYNGVRMITEISDIQTKAPDDLFAAPADLKKIESDQVRAQVDAIFRALGSVVSQMMQPSTSPAAPAR